MKFIYRQQLQKGQAMIVMMVMFLVIVTSVVVSALAPTLRAVATARTLQESKQSHLIAEAGIEDAIHRLKHGLDTNDTYTLSLGSSTTNITITNEGQNAYSVESYGNDDEKERRVRTTIVTADGYSFSYGVQVGTGGFILAGNAGVIGNVFSNGPITGANGSYVTGSAISAGPSGLIDGVDDVGGEGVGDAYAHTINGVTVVDNLYCQEGSSNNKSCDMSRADPETQPFPLDDDDITGWQDQAGETATTIEGDYVIDNSVTSIGPTIITGNLTISNGADVTLTGTLWVQGNIDAKNNVIINLDPSYEGSGEVILVDGYTELSNNVDFQGSGTEGSYIMLVSTSTCPDDVSCDSNPAIGLDNNVGTVIMNAQNGTIYFQNNAGAVSATADIIELSNNATIIYEEGLVNVNFSTGPSGTFTVETWREL